MKSLYESICSNAITESILSSTNTGKASFEVDLGLSVNWCSCNLGATKPEEAGEYFAWGDTMGYKENEIRRNMFSEEWYKKLPASKTKCDLKPNEDAAYEYFKGKFRMPTKYEIEDLIDNTRKKIEIINGIRGIRFTSMKNEKSIFIPFAGYAMKGSVENGYNSMYLWSSTYCGGNLQVDYAELMHCNTSMRPIFMNSVRYFGRNIRPVCDK